MLSSGRACTWWSRRRAHIAACALLLIAGCAEGAMTDAPTTSATTVPGTTTTLAVTATTTVPATGAAAFFGLSHLLYSATGDISFQGRVTAAVGSVTLTEAGNTIDVDGHDGSFWAEVSLAPGTHEVVFEATDQAGEMTTYAIMVIVDPGLHLQFSYIEGIDVDEGRLVATYAEWYSGDEAKDAARADGVIGPDDDIDGGYYIRTPSAPPHILTLADDPVVVLQACYPDDGPCVTSQRVDADTWQRLFADPESGYDVTGWWWYGTGALPYWLTIRDGVVVQVEEWYLP